MFICQNSEGVHPYLLKCWRGTCSFVGMLKGYMVRKRLRTPALKVYFIMWGHDLTYTDYIHAAKHMLSHMHAKC